MTQKTLEQMTMAELGDELASARVERDGADFIDGLYAWRTAKEAAAERIQACEAEIERRKSRHGAHYGG